MILRQFLHADPVGISYLFEKRHNQALMIEDEAEFIRFMLAEIPPAPPEASGIRAINAGLTAAAA